MSIDPMKHLLAVHVDWIDLVFEPLGRVVEMQHSPHRHYSPSQTENYNQHYTLRNRREIVAVDVVGEDNDVDIPLVVAVVEVAIPLQDHTVILIEQGSRDILTLELLVLEQDPKIRQIDHPVRPIAGSSGVAFRDRVVG